MKFDDPNQHSQPGDILWADNNFNKPEYRGPHYMIYLGPNGDDPYTFLGVMLTSAKKKYAGNVPMTEEYFEKNDADGNPWRVYYKNSLIVKKLFTKSVQWQPFEKCGQLTAAGLAFVRDQVGELEPEFFEGNAD